MWLRNQMTNEIGWHYPQKTEIQKLLVFINKGYWVTEMWDVNTVFIDAISSPLLPPL